jgi:hypothetical protein
MPAANVFLPGDSYREDALAVQPCLGRFDARGLARMPCREQHDTSGAGALGERAISVSVAAGGFSSITCSPASIAVTACS